MSDVSKLLELISDGGFNMFISTAFIIMAGFIAGYTIITKILEIFNVPVKWVKKRNKDHELLMQTVNDLKELLHVMEADAMTEFQYVIEDGEWKAVLK